MLSCSSEAYEKIEPHVTALERIVLDALADGGAMTASELAIFTGTDYAAIQPRAGQLFKRGLVKKIGRKPNAKGNNETVWMI